MDGVTFEGNIPAKVANALRQGRQEFDLSSEAAYAQSRIAINRAVLGVMGAVLLIFGVWFLIPPYRQPANFELGLAIPFIAGGGLILVLALRYRWRPPANQLVIDSEALRFGYTDGTRYSLEWNDPAFGLALYDHSEDPGTTASEKRHIWLGLPNGRGGTVPENVLEAIIAAAHEHGLPVLVREEVIPAGRGFARPEVTRIGRPENMPDWKKASPVRGAPSSVEE